jgi:mannose-6-phosphate isomerase-like protein (cupin superfamily)
MVELTIGKSSKKYQGKEKFTSKDHWSWRLRMRALIPCMLLLVGALAASEADVYTTHDLAVIKESLEKKHTSSAFVTLKKYGNHYTMLAYRDGTGSSELHKKEADILVVEKGEATIIIGGKMVGGHETEPGELRGTSIEGGEKIALKTGDVIHIPAGVPHQMLVTKGSPITYFVVKVSGQ